MTYVKMRSRGGQKVSTEGHIENFIASGGCIYYIYNRLKHFNKNFLHQPAQNEGNSSHFRLRKMRFRLKRVE